MKVTIFYSEKDKKDYTSSCVETLLPPSKGFDYWYIVERVNGEESAIYLRKDKINAVRMEEIEDGEIEQVSMSSMRLSN